MIEIIPATDIIGGQCVRLTQGDYASRKTYYRDPLEAALRFEETGIRRLHMVDLDGAKASEPRNLAVLERVATKTTLEVQYGGGIKSRGALRSVFDAGASRAICGSIAVREPESFAEWLAKFGDGKLILGADIRDGAVAVQGWTEQSEMTAQELIARFAPQGLAQVICTDIARDGMLCGASAESRTARISTLVEPDGMQITIRSEGAKRPPEVLTFLIMPRSISSVALKSAITPSFSGRIVLMLGLVFSCIWRA